MIRSRFKKSITNAFKKAAMKARPYVVLSSNEVFGWITVAGFFFAIASAVSVPLWLAIPLTVFIPFVGALVHVLFRWWEDKTNRLTLLEYDRFLESTSLAATAKISIVVTHFSEHIPDEHYQIPLLNKLKEGVPVRRVLGKANAKREEMQAWLHPFRALSNYSECVVDYDLPFDFAVYDDNSLILNLPSRAGGRRFNRAVEIHNPEVAKMFGCAFDLLCKDEGKTSEQEPNPFATGTPNTAGQLPTNPT